MILQRMATSRRMKLLLLEIGALFTGIQNFLPVSAEISYSFLNIPLESVTTISCFGPKYSGKSSLLSELFDTSSAEQVDECGITVSCDDSKNVAIIEVDIDDVPTDEALVAVGGSDIIVFNILLSSLSRDGLSTLKPLLEEVCDLYSKGKLKTTGNLKKLVVAVRDVESAATEKIISEKMPTLIQQLWADVAKPLKAASLKFSDLFELVIAPLPLSSQNSFSQYVKALSNIMSDAEDDGEDIGQVTKRFQQLEKRKSLSKQNPDMDIVTQTTAVNKINKETLDIYEELSLSLNADPEVNESFGVECEEIISDMLGYFDESVTDIKSSVVKGKRQSLLNQMLRDMQDKHTVQLIKLQDATFNVFRQKLAGVRVTATVADEMDQALKEAEEYFVSIAKKLSNKYADFVYEGAQSRIKQSMKEFCTERLQSAKLQGSFLISKDRKPVAISFNWLLPHPFGADARRTNFLMKPRPSYATFDKVDQIVTPLEKGIIEQGGTAFEETTLGQEGNPNHPVFRGLKPPKAEQSEEIF
mmetsp:Transcript_12995/g.16972  ORF Transcript_12995/g.16972 Transcript_12995/m.16972 type:complete len:529 (-) Transcript_12995:334-1920(-)